MIANKSIKPNHQTFSQRWEYESLPEPMKLESLSDDLRREVYNAFRDLFLTLNLVLNNHHIQFVERLLGRYKKVPEDEIFKKDTASMFYCEVILEEIKIIVTDHKFNKVLDFIEIAVNDRFVVSKFTEVIQQLFEKYSAAYWLDTYEKPYYFIPRTLEEQGFAVKESFHTLRESGMKAASIHLQQVAKQINTRDYPKAIVDSIHAIETVAFSIDPESKKGLTSALMSLEKRGIKIHPALKSGFIKIYGYTSNEPGIRHALRNKSTPNIGLDEAMFMFGACASFAAYLVSKHQKAERIKSDNK